MKRMLKWLLGLIVTAGVIVGLVYAFLQGRKELATEREREKPMQASLRATRTPDGQIAIKLDDDARQRVTIATAPLTAATHAPEVKAFGTVLDPSTLVALHGELVAAEVAVANSTAQCTRTKALFEEDQNASRRTLEAAEAQQRTDAARLLNAQQRWALATADAAAKMTSAEREGFVAKLVNRELALARVDLPAGDTTVTPSGGRVVLSGEEGASASVRAIYPAPSVDSTMRGEAFLLIVERPGSRLRPGAPVTAFLTVPGEAQNGTVIPARAVVRAAGLAWAYVQTAENEFTRREVSTANPTPDGWFVSQNFKTGEQVVVTGAQTLLSEEFKSQISFDEEGGK